MPFIIKFYHINYCNYLDFYFVMRNTNMAFTRSLEHPFFDTLIEKNYILGLINSSKLGEAYTYK